MSSVCKCQYCGKLSNFGDNAEWGFDCQHCGKFNESEHPTYEKRVMLEE